MRLSIIIPTLNEAAHVEETIRSARQRRDCEIIVVDGGSQDGTVGLCSEADIVLTTAQGRAAQQNAGAEAATGDVLLFLHADCRIEPGCLDAALAVCEQPNCVGGCFHQIIDAPGFRFRALEWGNALRVKCFRMAYGDQAIFIKAEIFHRLGGFPPLALMEDFFLMKQLRRQGKFVLLDEQIHVSARRWQQRGVLRQTLTNWTLATLAQLGVSPDRLVAYYRNDR